MKNGEQTLEIPSSLVTNTLYLCGTWNFAQEYTQNTSLNAKIQFKYQAKNVYFVASAGTAVKVKVTRDGGQPLGALRGKDVDVDGYVTIQANRLYTLIQDASYDTHALEMEIQGTGLQAYTFTFG